MKTTRTHLERAEHLAHALVPEETPDKYMYSITAILGVAFLHVAIAAVKTYWEHLYERVD